MERGDWTEPRLDDRFDHIDGELSALRQDMRDLRSELRNDMRGLEAGFRDSEGGLRGEIRDLRSTIHWFGGGMMLALIGVIAAILARGV